MAITPGSCSSGSKTEACLLSLGAGGCGPISDATAKTLFATQWSVARGQWSVKSEIYDKLLVLEAVTHDFLQVRHLSQDCHANGWGYSL